ncbi:hypothetical protein CEB3_c40710 [Peptococcaceae bacterium CEB3]|nr:hypothetical protein CEB3_c40710 [Peptococcaceae bacterium CEB3]
MCGQYGDFHGKGMGHDHHGCGCHGGQHGHGGCHGHGGGFGGHGWAFLTHEERVDRLVQVKKDLEGQLAEIQKTLNLLQPADKSQDSQKSVSED